MKYYSTLKGKEILSHATTWKNFEDIVLSKISQVQDDTYLHDCLYEVCKAVRFIETESKMMVSSGWEERIGSHCSMGTKFQILHSKVHIVYWTVHLKMAKI